MADVKKIPDEVIFRSHPSGVMDERQIEGILLGFYGRIAKSRDRRGGGKAVGEMPAHAVEWNDEEKRFVSIAGQPIISSGAVNKATGLPESMSNLMPNHRALYGWDLALKLVIPPEDFIAACIATDDVPQNEGKGESEKEWVALAYKPKFKTGPFGKPLTYFMCRKCGCEWKAELPDTSYPCIRCGADGMGLQHGLTDENGMPDKKPVVDSRIEDNWSDEEVLAVKENTRRLKHVLTELGGQGLFDLKPRIDEHKEGGLGTEILYDPEDPEEILGFRITTKGVRYCEEWIKEHPKLQQGGDVLDAMGPTLAKRAPQWLQAEHRKGSIIIVGGA